MSSSPAERPPAASIDPLTGQTFQIRALQRLYAAGVLRPEEVVAAVFRRIHAAGAAPIWIALRQQAAVLADLAALRRRQADGTALPLFGVPFAVKDNIDVAGMPTTAACPGAAYVPGESASVVESLTDAGALLIGKTNLDQFATGLVGTRSPYGVCRNAFDPAYVSGGSSSGSALAVALGQVSFALGTDTAGSGRVPAAFNNIVGFKPSVGAWSTRGVLPACRSIDCVSAFTLNCSDAARLHAVLDGFHPEERLSRGPSREPRFLATDPERGFRFGVPQRDQWAFFGDREYERLYEVALARLAALGGSPVEIDAGPFFAAGDLLYRDAFVAERWAAIGHFIAAEVDGVDPTVHAIVESGQRLSAAEAFKAQYRLADLKRAADAEMARIDVLALPTAGTIHTIAAVAEQPIARNAELGRTTTFVNLLDFCAIAVPAGFRIDSLPFGIQLIAPPGLEPDLLFVADRFHRAQDLPAGATGAALDPDAAVPRSLPERRIAVVGAHLEGQPLNHQLTERGGRLIGPARTSPDYRLYDLAGTAPAKPGLVRVATGGASIEVEVWALTNPAFGAFVAQVPPPLGIGTVTLADGGTVQGFLAEPHALDGARDITGFEGWRAFLAARA